MQFRYSLTAVVKRNHSYEANIQEAHMVRISYLTVFQKLEGFENLIGISYTILGTRMPCVVWVHGRDGLM